MVSALQAPQDRGLSTYVLMLVWVMRRAGACEAKSSTYTHHSWNTSGVHASNHMHATHRCSDPQPDTQQHSPRGTQSGYLRCTPTEELTARLCPTSTAGSSSSSMPACCTSRSSAAGLFLLQRPQQRHENGWGGIGGYAGLARHVAPAHTTPRPRLIRQPCQGLKRGTHTGRHRLLT